MKYVGSTCVWGARLQQNQRGRKGPADQRRFRSPSARDDREFVIRQGITAAESSKCIGHWGLRQRPLATGSRGIGKNHAYNAGAFLPLYAAPARVRGSAGEKRPKGYQSDGLPQKHARGDPASRSPPYVRDCGCRPRQPGPSPGPDIRATESSAVVARAAFYIPATFSVGSWKENATPFLSPAVRITSRVSS